MKKYFNQKVKGCEYLVNLNTKKINKNHIITAAEKVNLPVYVMEKAWKNFQETGGKRVDLSSTNASFKLTGIKPTVKQLYTKEKVLPAKKAAAILLEYMMDRDIRSVELCNKYQITVQQFYKWIHELNVAGTICDKTILNHKKYAKVNVIDAIWMYKRPETKRKSIKKLTSIERLAYKRVGDVLVHYLSAV